MKKELKDIYEALRRCHYSHTNMKEYNFLIDARAFDKALDSIPPREYYVLLHRYSIPCAEFNTLVKIAEELQCTPERVRQLESKAIQRLYKGIVKAVPVI